MCVVMTTQTSLSPLISPAKPVRSRYFHLIITFTACILVANGSEAIPPSPSTSTSPELNNSTTKSDDANITTSADQTQWNATISIDFLNESQPTDGYLVSSYPSNNSVHESMEYSNQSTPDDGAPNPAHNRTNTPILDTQTLFSVSRELCLRLLEFAFMFLAFMTVVCTIRTCIRRQSMRCYSLSIGFFLSSLAASRTLTLMLVPASGLPSGTTSTLFLTLFNLPFPSLLASFTLVFFSILHLTKVHPFNSCVLCVLITLQFFFVLFLDIFLHYFSGGNQIPIGELTFSLWFWLFSLIFFYYFRQLRFVSLRKQSEIMRFTFTKLHIEGGRLPSTLPYSPLKLVTTLIFTSVVLTLVLTFLLVCNVIMKLGIYDDVWSLNFRFIVIVASRILEIIVSFILLYITMQPLDVAINKSVFSAFSDCTCSDICGDKSSLGDDIYPTYCANNSAVARTQFTFEQWNSANNCSQSARINSASLGIKKVNETINRSCVQSRSAANNRRQITLSTLATLSNVHSHPPSKLCNDNSIGRYNSNLDLDEAGPITPRKSPARNLFNAIMLKRCESSDSSGFDVHLQRRSSITKTEELSRRRSGGSTPAKECRKIPNLNLSSVATTKPPKDITPDSAVDLEFPSDIIAYPLPLSHSMNNLQAGCYGITSSTKHKKLSHSLLSRLRSSTFSLSSYRGYEQFDSTQPNFHRNWEMKTAFRESGASSRVSRDVHSDSDDLSSCFNSQDKKFNSVVCVSTEVQTEPFDFVHQVVIHTNSEV